MEGVGASMEGSVGIDWVASQQRQTEQHWQKLSDVEPHVRILDLVNGPCKAPMWFHEWQLMPIIKLAKNVKNFTNFSCGGGAGFLKSGGLCQAIHTRAVFHLVEFWQTMPVFAGKKAKFGWQCRAKISSEQECAVCNRVESFDGLTTI